MRKNWIDVMVLGVLEVYGTNNPKDLFKAMDFRIDFIEKDNILLAGNNSNIILELNTVYMSTGLPEKHIDFYLGHELGHLLLHFDEKNIKFTNSPKIEKEADYFSYKLSNINFNEIEMYQMTYEQIASCLEVPSRAIKQLVNL